MKKFLLTILFAVSVSLMLQAQEKKVPVFTSGHEDRVFDWQRYDSHF